MTDQQAGRPGKRKVMVVEDDAGLRETLRDVLEEAGYAVLTAADGLEALAHLNGGARPQAIILDLLMPHMDGFELLRELNRHVVHAAIPTIVMTSISATVSKTIAAVAVIKKPVDVPTLMATLDVHCGA